jgi:hypothetical protein
MKAIILTAIFTAIIILTIEEYHYQIAKPVRPKKPKPFIQEWQTFVEANINSCFTEEHCLQCTSLIHLFDRKFRRQTPAPVFNQLIEKLWNRLDAKYKDLNKVSLSKTTVDQLLNEVR